MNIEKIEKVLKEKKIPFTRNDGKIIVGQYESLYRRIRLRRDKAKKTFLYEKVLSYPCEKNIKVYLDKIIGVKETVSQEIIKDISKLAKLYSNFLNQDIYLSMDNFNNGVKILLNQNSEGMEEILDDIRDDLTRTELRNT